MRTPCVFKRTPKGFKCSACGRSVASRSEKPPQAVCRAPRGLGDVVADGLAAVGITKERAQKAANAVGIKDCGCSKRQAALNELGRKLGIGS